MSLSDWLSKISPDAALGALTFLGTLGTWAWARGKQTQSFSSSNIIDDIMENFLHELLDDYNETDKIATYLNHARDFVEKQAWKVLAKRKIPRNAVTERLLHAAIERMTAKLANKIAERLIPKQLEDIVKRTNIIANTLPAPTP